MGDGKDNRSMAFDMAGVADLGEIDKLPVPKRVSNRYGT